MSTIHINGIKIANYRSFKEEQTIIFPDKYYKKPVAIVGYNNSGKTNLLNSLLIGIREKYVTKENFTINDFHNRNLKYIPKIIVGIETSEEIKLDKKYANLTGYHHLEVEVDGNEIENIKVESYKDGKKNFQAFGANKYYKIFYVNFHDIKKEIMTKKTSWGNIASFLGKHIKNIVDSDEMMLTKKAVFKSGINQETKKIIEKSKLEKFIINIQKNYSENLRGNNCNIDFGLPEYEDIFLEMMFKVGLNGDEKNLVPIDQFGDGYISMFVMAIIKAIAEDSIEDKCLFLFEEPESFLHENHQEYFYKTVLCGLAKNGHQVIYTTHSDKMIDIFDTKGLIRVEFDEESKNTKIKYNKAKEEFDGGQEILDEIKDYNNYIKIIEPNLNKIIFSRKVVLVEGPNDMMVYKEAIRRKVFEITKDEQYANTYLNFNNISIIAHHGKATALILIKLCKHLGLDYFVINDFDFSINFVSKLKGFTSESEYKQSSFYQKDIDTMEVKNRKGELLSSKTKKSMITNNWNLINEAGDENIHFNIPRLEEVIGYKNNDKESIEIWKIINKEPIGEELFPSKLVEFLEFDKISIVSKGILEPIF